MPEILTKEGLKKITTRFGKKIYIYIKGQRGIKMYFLFKIILKQINKHSWLSKFISKLIKKNFKNH